MIRRDQPRLLRTAGIASGARQLQVSLAPMPAGGGRIRVMVFFLISTDSGRSVSDAKPNLEITDLPQRNTAASESLAVYGQEIGDTEGHWFVLRIRP